MARIFVSYARSTRPAVERVVADLRASGHDPFFDNVLAGGQNWWNELLDHIEQCDVFMPVMSGAYLASVPCRLEAEYANRLDRRILPVALEVVSNQLCPAFIAETQWIAYTPTREGILELMRGVNADHRVRPVPKKKPARPPVPISYLTELKDRVESPVSLSRETQLGIVGELRSRLDGDEADVLHLLHRLRARPDLYQQVAVDIDALLGSLATAAAGTASRSVHSPLPPPVQRPEPQPQSQRRLHQAPQPHQPNPEPQRHFAPEAGPAWTAGGSKPANFRVWAIVVAVACLATVWCLPAGVIAVYQSFQVDRRWRADDHAGALRASHRARAWIIACGLLAVVVLTVMIGATFRGS